jgi:hypothetical protein
MLPAQSFIQQRTVDVQLDYSIRKKLPISPNRLQVRASSQGFREQAANTYSRALGCLRIAEYDFGVDDDAVVCVCRSVH